MKNFKLYKLLFITLLLSISVFCYLYLTKINKKTTIETQAEVYANENEIEVITPEPKKEIYYNTLPKSPIDNDNYIFQNIGGDDNDVLNKAYKIKDETFIIMSSNSEGLDIVGSGEKIVVGKLQDLTLQKTLTLTTDEEFQDSKILSNGIAILSSCQDGLNLYNVGYDLINTKKVSIPYGNNGSLYLDNNDLFVFSYSNTTFNIVYCTNFNVSKVSTTYINDIESVFSFKTSSGFDFIVNTKKGYTYLSYSIISGFTSSNSIINTRICEIIPISSGYIGTSIKDNIISIFNADKSLNITNSIDIGTAKLIKVFTISDNICAITSIENKSYLNVYCKHLDLTFQSEIPYIESILNFDYKDNSFIGYSKNLVEYFTLSNLQYSLEYSYFGNNSNAYLLSDGTICFTSNYKNDTIIRNYGNEDVILILKKS